MSVTQHAIAHHVDEGTDTFSINIVDVWRLSVMGGAKIKFWSLWQAMTV